MGTDELTRIHELAKRVTLLEKMALRQQSRIDELVERLEAAEQRAGGIPPRREAQKEPSDNSAAEANAAAQRAKDGEELAAAMKEGAERIYRRRARAEETQEERDGRPTIRIPQEEPVRGYLLHAVRHMEEHMAEPITVREVADELGLSVSYVHKLFARCGTSFSAYLTDCRLRHAGQR